MKHRSSVRNHSRLRKYLKFIFGLCYLLLLCPDSVLALADGTTCMSSSSAKYAKPNYRLLQDPARVDDLLKLSTDSLGSNLLFAKKVAHEALVLSEKLNYVMGIVSSHCALADVYRLKADFGAAEKEIQQAISLSEYSGDKIGLATSYLAMYQLLFAQGDYKNAGSFNKRALDIGETTLNKQILADAYGNEGVMLGIGGKHIQAVTYFLKSLEIYRSLNDQLMTALVLMRIGHTFELAGSYDKALDYLNLSLEVNQKLKHWRNVGWCFLNIGVTYSRIYPENYALKLEYYEKALVMAERSGDVRLQLACMDNIGGNYSMSGDYKNANAWLKRAYDLSKTAGHNSRTVFITGNLAENYLYTGELDSALLFGEENLRIALAENNTFEKRQSYAVLSQIHAARNENRQAYEMLLRHTRLSDSIFNVQKSQQIEDLREKYETERKNQEIELLTKEKEAVVFRRNSLGVLALLFLLVGVLGFAVLKLREKKNRLILQKEIELDRMKSRFFANISHEFRTPLTLILGPIDDMIIQRENAGIIRHLKPMRRNAARLLELVNQLLELSKIEAGKLKLALTRNNIVSIVKGIGMSFDSLAQMRNIRLEVAATDESLEVFLDVDKFEKILANLLSNAFKFTPENGNISIRVNQTDYSHLPGIAQCVEISVKDSGSGIPKDEMSHIFDRFYQADHNQLLQQDGSGIGLALTKELVDLHRGVIWVHPDVEAGTEIRFQIPLNLDESLREYISETIAPRNEIPVMVSGAVDTADHVETEHDSRRPIVLLIEDHIDVRNYIRGTLDPVYTVIEAGDGEAGVALALERIPDLILSDVMMPKRNGHQVCAMLKHEERTSHIPIILLTAKADMDSRIEGLENRADDYLTKPFAAKELLIRIHNLIESRKELRQKYLHAMTLKPGEVSVSSLDEQFLKRMMELIERNMSDEKFSVEALSSGIGMSRSHLHRKLKALTGQGPNQFIRSFRLNRAHDLLKVNAASAAEIAYTVGFSSPSYFTKCFHEQFGYTPSDIGSHQTHPGRVSRVNRES